MLDKKTPCVGQDCRLRDCFCRKNLLEITCVSMRKRTIKRTLFEGQSCQDWDVFHGKNWEQKDVFLFHIVNKKTSRVGLNYQLRGVFGGGKLSEITCVSMRKRTTLGRVLWDRVDNIGTCFVGRIGNKKTCSCFTSSTKRRLVWHETINFGTFFFGGGKIT